jgi:mitochondrial inner membrane protein COX18
MEEAVVPQLEKSKPEIYTRVIQQMQKEQVRGTRESIKQEHAKRSAAQVRPCPSQLSPLQSRVSPPHSQLRSLQKELCATYRCKPWPTALAPLASQLPLFIGITYVLRHLSADPTPFDSESFMSLANLANPDPTFALPVVLGIITLVNVESYKWFQTPTQIAQEQNAQSLTSKRRTEGRIIVPWREIFRTGMRLATPVRMIVAAMMPGVGHQNPPFRQMLTAVPERRPLLDLISKFWARPELVL